MASSRPPGRSGSAAPTAAAASPRSSPLSFHPRCGQLVSFVDPAAASSSASSSSATTSAPPDRRVVAHRTHASQEFNHGLVMSSQPLQDNQIFEVRIEKKIHSWSGSIEVGVTSCDPDELEAPFPSSATELRHGTWIMSGNSILKDGRSINENYGTDLDKLEEGDRVGVLRTSNGDLIFFVNGVSQSIAASSLPDRLFAVVDMYGKCAQVAIMDNTSQEARIVSNELSNEATAAAACHNSINLISSNSALNNITNSNIAAAAAAAAAALASQQQSAGSSSASGAAATFSSSQKIRFHERRGSLTRLSNNNRTSERRRPYDEFNNGVVMTHRPLKDNELFEIRIDRLVDKWSGSIEVGITTHNPNTLDFPATMTNQKSGTMMMSGCGILTNGRGTRREYGDFNLDELNEGDRIGMMRKANGNLHFYINGLDQGVAATKVPQQMWGVVDLYGMTVKVTIVDRDERDEQNLITRRNVAAMQQQQQQYAGASSTGDDDAENHRSHRSGSHPDLPHPLLAMENRLLFHPNCGSHAAVINGGMSAHRPNAADDFNFGVVLTNRPLRANEVFEVRLDKMVSKWAGSIEIGVTTHSPNDLDFPSTMTNLRSGTWMMTGNGVMHNGTTVIDDYGQNLDKLKEGDRVAVVRKEPGGTLHFFVNSEDQGPAATNVPECVYGVIDLYGQAAQATLIDLADYRSPMAEQALTNMAGSAIVEASEATSATLYSQIVLENTDELRFHHLHGRNARIGNNGITASRPNALGEFNDAIVISNRPLRDDEPFEIVIERMVERWSGSIEAGVTLIRPEDLEFPNTMTDIDYDTWMLSGSAVMRDGQTVRNGYCCDLDTLSVGSRLGMVRTRDGTLRYTINGEDQGLACDNIPPNVYAVVDLYGQCAQVSIVHSAPLQTASQAAAATAASGLLATTAENSQGSSQVLESSHASLPPGVMVGSEVAHRFAAGFGAIAAKGIELKNNNQSCVRHPACPGGLVFGGSHLEESDVFEVRIDAVDSHCTGALKIGVTTAQGQASDPDMRSLRKRGKTFWLENSSVHANGRVVKMNYAPSLDRLSNGDKVSVRRTPDGCLRFAVNGEDFGVAATNVPKRVTPVLELAGSIRGVTVTSTTRHQLPLSQQPQGVQQQSPSDLADSLETAALPGGAAAAATDSTTRAGANNQAERKRSPQQLPAPAVVPLEFHENHGRNLKLKNGSVSATRTDSYNQGLAVSNRPLIRGELFQVSIDKLNSTWSSSLMLGVLTHSPEKLHLPVSALGLKKNSIVVCGDGVFRNGTRISRNSLRVGQAVGVMVDSKGQLRIFVNGVDQGVVAKGLTSNAIYGVADVYGQCEEISLLTAPCDDEPAATIDVLIKPNPSSVTTVPTVAPTLRGHCEYHILCQRFKQSLSLPSTHFLDPAVCHCPSCHRARGDPAYVKKGNPVRDSSTPVGWCRFPVRRPSLAVALDTDEWHTAFLSSRPNLLRRILDSGGGDITPTGVRLEQPADEEKPKSKEDDGEPTFVALTPTVRYVETFCPRVAFSDRGSRRRYHALVALVVDVHPGSYKIGPPTLASSSSSSPPDPHFKLDETEWLTKERGNTAVTAVLVKIIAT